MKRKVQKIAIIMLIFSVMNFVEGTGALINKVITQTIDDAIKAAEKISGKTLSGTARVAARKSLEQAIVKYGDDAIRAAREGGVELFSASSKHGDIVWKYAAKYPNASRAIAFGADHIIPLAAKVGDDVILVEMKSRGLSKIVVNNFGDDAIKAFAKMPEKDAIKIAGVAGYCKDDAVKKMLLKAYEKTPNKEKFIEYFTPGRIIAGGVAVGTVIAAYKVSGGTEKMLESVGEGLEKNDKALNKFVSNITSPFWFAGIALAIIISLWLAFKLNVPVAVAKFVKNSQCSGNTKKVQIDDSEWQRPTNKKEEKGDLQA